MEGVQITSEGDRPFQGAAEVDFLGIKPSCFQASLLQDHNRRKQVLLFFLGMSFWESQCGLLVTVLDYRELSSNPYSTINFSR